MPIRIFIDQGHNPTGAPNAGAIGGGLSEQDVTYQVGIFLADLLAADDRFSVRVSRPMPDTVLGTSNATSLAARVNAANSWPADYFLSIHCNANPNPAINGTEAYVYEEFSESYWLAQYLVSGIVATVGTRDNGIFANTSLYVLRRTQMPSVLVELAYLTNPADAAKLAVNPQGFALGLYSGLLNYFGFV